VLNKVIVQEPHPKKKTPKPAEDNENEDKFWY